MVVVGLVQGSGTAPAGKAIVLLESVPASQLQGVLVSLQASS